MNKQEFLNQLKSELSGLSPSDIEDILRDQEEYFREGQQSGRDEESLLKSLGSPVDLAKELKAQYQINAAHAENKIIPKSKSILKAVLALCVLAPFNLIFVLGPFLGLCGTLIGAWSTILAMALIAIPILILGLIFVISISQLLGFIGIFSGVGLLGFAALSFVIMYYVTEWIMKITVSYLKWNMKFISDSAQ